MEIKICIDNLEWEKWQKAHKQANFLQSWDWGVFQEKFGKAPLRLQAVENGEVFWQGQGFVYNLGLGIKYLYLPRFEAEEKIFKLVIEYCRMQGFSFLRVEPIDGSFKLSKVESVKSRQPQTTLILNLEKDEDVILANMHAKTRYNIGLAEKKGVTVKEEKRADIFWQLNQETTGRDKFKSHERNYYEKMLDSGFCHQLTAYYNNQPIASDIFIVYNGTCTYLHGASANEQRNLMAPYLLQWEAIKMAKRLGCVRYDFWGIAPTLNSGDSAQKSCFNNFCWEVNHPWTGVTRFKVGFGGEVVSYGDSVDVILNSFKYFVYKIARKIKK